MSVAKNIPDGWVETTLGEVCLVGDGAHSKVERKKNGVIYLTAKNFNRGSLKLDNIDYISIEDFDRLFSINSKAVTRLKENDVLMGIIGSFGNAYRYKKDDFFGISSSVAILRPIIERLNSRFLELYLNSNLFRRIHETFSSGSVQGYSNIPTIKKMPIILPPLPEQKSIASILTAFDDKIELLQAQNKTLEETAQTIFAEWFGKYKNGDELPEGWSVGKLGEVTKTYGGTTPSTTNPNFWDGDIYWTSPKDLSNSKGIFLLNTDKKITKEGLKKISSGLLPKRTLLLSSRAPIGYLALTNIELAINQGYIAIVPEQYFSNNFMYLWLTENMKLVENASNGSTFMEISKSSFRNIDCVIPNKEILEKFDNFINPTFEKVLFNLIQIQTLTKTRDELLPRLMSGAVQVQG